MMLVKRKKERNTQTEKRKKTKKLRKNPQKSKRARETISHVCTSTLFTQCCDWLIGPGPSHTSSYCSETTHTLPAPYCSTEVLHAHMTTVTRVYIPFTKSRFSTPPDTRTRAPCEDTHTDTCVCVRVCEAHWHKQ